MQIGKPDAQAAPRLHVLDAERDDDLAALAGDGDLAADVFALVAMLGEDQQHRPAAIERGDDLQRRRPVFADVADEQEVVKVRHRAKPVPQTPHNPYFSAPWPSRDRRNGNLAAFALRIGRGKRSDRWASRS